MNKKNPRGQPFPRLLFISLIAVFVAAQFPKLCLGKITEKGVLSSARLGAGMGIPYGGKGANLEFVWGNRFGLTGGMGGKKEEGRHWAVGGRLYSKKGKTGLNPRFSGFYGAAGRVEDAGGEAVDVLKGYVLGVGFDWRLTTRLTFDFDWFYFRHLEDVDSALVKDRDKLISFGLGVQF